MTNANAKFHDHSYKDRVTRELDELDIKIARLDAFIGGVVYSNLPPEEQARLDDQSFFMGKYSRLLSERIESNFK